MEEELLMRYVEDNKQRFEVIVIPRDLSKVMLKLAHDDLGHNGSARTYMIGQKKLLLERFEARCGALCEKVHGVQKTQFCITQV